MVVLFAVLTACGGDEAFTRSSESVAAGRFGDAVAMLHFEPRHVGGHGSSAEHITLSLSLSAHEPPRLELDDHLRGDGAGETPAAEWNALLAATPQLSALPDGRGLALSLDGGAHHRLIALDLEPPLYCRHRTFTLGGDDGPPSSRALVLEILATRDPPTPGTLAHLVVGEYPVARERFTREFAVARAHACAHGEDLELRDATIAALVEPGAQLFANSDFIPLVRCVAGWAAAQAEVRGRLSAALPSAPTIERGRIALALAATDDPAVEAALAAQLEGTPPCTDANDDCREQRWMRHRIAWALGAVVARRGAISPAAHRVALALTREADGALQVDGVRILATAPDAEATARLQELAAAPCSTTLDTLPPHGDADDDIPARELPACWARAALPG